jgi:glucose-6-phosphate 1-dehydrogenase
MPKTNSNPLEDPQKKIKSPDPCTLVIFGATGDLTARKLIPAIYNLGKEAHLPINFACVGVARREKSHEEFRNDMQKNINNFSRTKPIDKNFWPSFKERLFYHQSQFDEDQGYESLKSFLSEIDSKHSTQGNRIFYLSVQPKFFPLIIEKLKKHDLIYNPQDEKWSRVIIEKPFGRDYTSAKELQNQIQKHISEEQTYRIDHYLGKETVQNILVFRFANSIFESIWNYKHIDHIQITVAEDIGIENRGEFFEEEGLTRDVIQNHMMQLLSIIAMEAPVDLSEKGVRDEKVKVLQSIRLFKDDDFKNFVVRGQYKQGFVNGEKVKSYREEDEVSDKSNIETFAAMRFFIDNWRWDKVPFYIRGGKRLPKKVTEIAVIFKDAPGILFKQENSKNEPNVLAIRIQPNEGISIKMNCKVPGPYSPIQPVKMDFRYGSYFGKAPPEAYERLILECINGDSTLFARSDEVLQSWKIFTPILKYWSENPMNNIANYESGTWGPIIANDLIEKDNRNWRMP